MSTVDVEIIIQPKGRGKPRRDDRAAREAATPRIPRITRLMALAIKFQDMVDRSEVRDYADLARLGYVSRARLTQIMNLLLLAPDIQESILLASDLSNSIPLMREHTLRKLSAEVMWGDQRQLWLQ
ncbi:MAG: hypothetical protein HY820_28515 [Acidobacteria bacterium]|nr:hypothetical protein [Acidobacteriota bacterium]